MKNLLLSFVLLTGSLNCFSQSSLFSNNTLKSYANWEVANQEAKWQFVFTSKIKDKGVLIKALETFLKQNPNIQNVIEKNFEITADISKLKVDYKKYGGSTRYTPQAFVNGLWNGKLKVEIVDGSYEMIISKLAFDVERKGLNAGKGIIESGDGRGSWATSVLSKDRMFLKESKKVDMDLFNKVFMDIFDLKK